MLTRANHEVYVIEFVHVKIIINTVDNIITQDVPINNNRFFSFIVR